MTFKCYSRSPSIVTFAVSTFTVSEIQAVLMLKTTFLPTPLVFDLEFEGHADSCQWNMQTKKFGA